MLFQNFLFDFDGTLANSSPLHERAFRQTLAEAAPRALRRFDYAVLTAITALHSCKDSFATAASKASSDG